MTSDGSPGRRPRARTVGLVATAAILLGTSIGYAATLAVTSQDLGVFQPTNLPSTCSGPGGQTVAASADAWVDEASTGTNNGADTSLYVRTESAANRRTFIIFNLPSIPSGCTLATATLRLNATAYDNGRTIRAFAAGAAWVEGTVTWSNQPGETGTGASSASGSGWRTWDVTAIVGGMYSGSNFGLRLRDNNEGHGSGKSQTYVSSEGAANTPELALTWA